jgi:molecular chaperone DnaJ
VPEPDHYAVLGVDRRANAEEIKRAFRRLTLEHHPDRHRGDPQAEERYRAIAVAYAVLSDPIKRSRYDAAMLQQGLDLSRMSGQTARDLLSTVFGDVFGTRRNRRRRGRDVRYTLTVELAEAVLGSTHAIEFEAPGPCTACSGSGTRPGGRPPQTCPVCEGRGEVKGDGLLARRTRCGRCDGTGMVQADPCETCRGAGTRRQQRAFEVRLPPGTAAGAERVLEGQGEPGRFGGGAGDLRVTVNVRPDPDLVREGDEIRCEVWVSVTEAALGARVRVPTVDGAVELAIPAGVKSGAKLRLRGKGVPRGKGGRGDQIVVVLLETPLTTDVGVRDALAALERASEHALPRRAEQRRRS